MGSSCSNNNNRQPQTDAGQNAAAPTIQNPRRITEGPVGQLLVSDRRGWIVAVDQANLEPVWGFQLPQEGAPFGVAAWNQLVFVGNTETKNVEVYRLLEPNGGTTTLNFEYNLGDIAAGAMGSIRNPISISIARKAGLVFVLDGDDKKVKIFASDGPLINAFEPRDSAGELLSPVSLVVDETRQEVLVGDYGDPSGSSRAKTPARILIYDYAGSLLFQIKGDNSTHWSTQFARVQGMATSADGRIFVADPLGSRILVLDRVSGALVTELGQQGRQPGQLMLPLDVVLDQKTGDLFITNNQGARRVEVLRGAGS
jgi:outer membrane protein assembly factor BamB